MKNQINDLILKLTGLCLIKPHPKHSIRFCKDYFKDKEIDVIEIGTYRGVNAKHILNNLNINNIYLIDPYKEYKDDNEDKIIVKDDNYLKDIKDKAHNLLYIYNNVNWIEKFSDDAVNDIPIVDYIYIDGEHTYEQCSKDLINYYPKVKESGILAGHDIHIVGVLNAVQDFCMLNGLHFQVAGQDWWIIKEVKNV